MKDNHRSRSCFFCHLYLYTWWNHFEKTLKMKVSKKKLAECVMLIIFFVCLFFVIFCLFLISASDQAGHHFCGSVACWLPFWREGDRGGGSGCFRGVMMGWRGFWSWSQPRAASAEGPALARARDSGWMPHHSQGPPPSAAQGGAEAKLVFKTNTINIFPAVITKLLLFPNYSWFQLHRLNTLNFLKCKPSITFVKHIHIYSPS